MPVPDGYDQVAIRRTMLLMGYSTLNRRSLRVCKILRYFCQIGGLLSTVAGFYDTGLIVALSEGI
jgi:hypothetical protein